MNTNEVLDLIINILKKQNIEIINYTDTANNTLLTFIYKSKKCYITNEGQLFLDDLSEEDNLYIKKIIIYAQRKVGIDKKLPLSGFDEDKLELRTVRNLSYKVLMIIKNQCFMYRYDGIFGIQYLLCEQKKTGFEYQYLNVAYYYNILKAEQYYASRTSLYIKPLNCFTNEELETILFYIEKFNENEKSNKLREKSIRIENKITQILKGDNNAGQ